MEKEQKDEVSVCHPEYAEKAALRTIFDDVCDGTRKLREKRTEYLPQAPAELVQDYEERLKTATLFNITEKTVNVMTGLVFRDQITLGADMFAEFPALWENIDNAGTHGDVFAREAFEKSFKGFSVILVENSEYKAESSEDRQRAGARPYWRLYDADAVWNWSYRINEISKATELELLVLKEITRERVGRFLLGEVTRYRAYFLNDDGSVSWELYREDKDKDGKVILVGEHPDNNTLPGFTQIPAAVVGKIGDEPPLMEIAYKNIEHFQTYSDYKNHIHKTCVPMLVIKGESPAKASTKVVGASVAWALENPDGDVSFTEIEGKSLETVRQSLVDMREEMALMGLSLLADKTAKVDVTATEALLNNIGETAELRVMARSLQDALELAAGFTAVFYRKQASEGGSFELGTAWLRAEREAQADNTIITDDQTQ